MGDDPFFAEVRRRLPDVDIVALPPVAAESAVTGPHRAEAIASSARQVVIGHLVSWWGDATAGLPPPTELTTHWTSAGPDHLVIADATARHAGRGDGDPRIRVTQAERALRRAGWSTTRRDPDAPRFLRLHARRGPLRLQVYVWSEPDAYDVSVRHRPVDVGPLGRSLPTTARTRHPWPPA